MYLLLMFSQSKLVEGKDTISTHSLQHSDIVEWWLKWLISVRYVTFNRCQSELVAGKQTIVSHSLHHGDIV